MTDVYRHCASIVVLRRSPQGMEVLLLRKPRKNDSWQLPQGGIEDGEELEGAALRELKEEAGVSATVIGGSERVYQYDFPPSYRRFRPDHVRGQHIQFVFAILPDDATIRVDEKEIHAFVWVVSSDLPKYIRRAEYLQVVEQLLVEGAKLLR